MKKPKPIISIIVPIHNMYRRLQNLEAWISEIDHPNVEVRLVDDFTSIEASEEILRLKNKFDYLNIELIQGTYGDPGLARNAGMHNVNSEWIAFCDSDDFYFTSSALQAIDSLKTPKSIIVGRYTTQEYNHRSAIFSFTKFKSKPSIYSIVRNPGIWRFIFKTEAINGITFPSLRMGEDQVFLIRVLSTIPKMARVKEHIYIYMVGRSDSLTSRFSDSSRNNLALELIKSTSIHTSALHRIVIYSLRYKLFVSTFVRSKLNFQSKNARPLTRVAGGLGNQLFQVVFALTKDSNVEVFGFEESSKSNFQEIEKIELSSMAKIDSAVTPWRPVRLISNLQLRLSLHQPNFAIDKVKQLSKLIEKTLLVIGSKDIYPKQIEITLENTSKRISNISSGYFQDYRNVDEFVSRHGLEPFKLLVEDAEVESYRTFSRHENPLIVQIRLGDYRSEHRIGMPSQDYFKSSIEDICEEFNFGSIWLFSNEPSVAATLIDGFSGLPIRIIPTTLSPMQTLQVMRFGAGYIISNSTFGWWGAYLAEDRNCPVISPSPWFKVTKTNVRLNCPSWRTRNPWHAPIK